MLFPAFPSQVSQLWVASFTWTGKKGKPQPPLCPFPYSGWKEEVKALGSMQKDCGEEAPRNRPGLELEQVRIWGDPEVEVHRGNAGKKGLRLTATPAALAGETHSAP